MKKRILLLSVISSLSALSFADGAITGQVNNIAIDRIYEPPRAFIKVAGDKSDAPACHTNSKWSFALPLETEEDYAVYSLLLSAHATGKEAVLEGRGLCDVHSSVETLTYLKY